MIKSIKQDEFASTLMSSVKAAYSFYYDDSITDSMLFGLTGHAFVTHITNGLGPCAPYIWDGQPFNELCKANLGLNIFGENEVVTSDSSAEKKMEVTRNIMNHLDSANLVLLSSYEYQLIVDYDDTFFITTKPWKEVESVTQNFELNSFKGMKEFMTCFMISRTNRIDLKEGIKRSLKYAISLYENSKDNTDSGFGIEAYDFWLEKITEENANAHGNWWTSTVWAESRKMASKYMIELKSYFDSDMVLEELSVLYDKSYTLFTKIADRDLDMKDKIELIKLLKRNELAIFELLKKLI